MIVIMRLLIHNQFSLNSQHLNLAIEDVMVIQFIGYNDDDHLIIRKKMKVRGKISTSNKKLCYWFKTLISLKVKKLTIYLNQSFLLYFLHIWKIMSSVNCWRVWGHQNNHLKSSLLYIMMNKISSLDYFKMEVPNLHKKVEKKNSRVMI